MRIFTSTLIALLTCALPALAAGPANESGSALVLLFIGFGATILIYRLFPGAALFAVMLKEIFIGSDKKTMAPTAKGQK